MTVLDGRFSTVIRKSIRKQFFKEKKKGKLINDLLEEYFNKSCKTRPAYDLANKGVYDRNLDNWEYLCRSCHMVKDGRMDRFHSRENYEKISKSLMGHQKFYKGDKRWP